MEKIKEIIANYSWWGLFLGVITLLIKPFISIRQSLRDMLITFIVSMLCGLMAEYMDIPIPVKYGISGVCGLFAVRLYMIADALLKKPSKIRLAFSQKLKTTSLIPEAQLNLGKKCKNIFFSSAPSPHSAGSAILMAKPKPKPKSLKNKWR